VTRRPAIVDRLAHLAGDAEPPPLDEIGARRIVERAIAAPASSPVLRSPKWAMVVAAAACVVVIAWLVSRTTGPREPELLHFALPTGDRLVGLPGTRFDVEKLEASERRLRLASGTVLCEVAHLAAGQRFQVTTAHLVATAKGTVFSVETDAAHSRVRVFDGTVEVVQAGAPHLLPAGATWDSRAGSAVFALERPRALAADIAAAIDRREPVRAAAAPPVAVVAPAPAVPVETVAPVREAPRIDTEPVRRLLSRARAALSVGHFDEALAIVYRAKARGKLAGTWWVVMGDALRGLGRVAEAADAFDVAAGELSGSDAIESMYSASYLRFHDLHDATAALASLGASVDAAGSPLEERGLGLRAQILDALGRHAEARAVAERYLARFPTSDLQTLMSDLIHRP
jgi:FecR protein